MANKSQARPVKRSGGINPTFLGAVILGICILIAGLNISGSVKKLNKTITETQFAATNTLSVPSEMTVGNNNYMTESEAGEYLNLSTEKIIELIANGEITEYVKTDSGYSISVKVLDEWFDNEAYQTKLKYNAAAAPAEDPEAVTE
ncbi:MAG: hypothetical protein IKK42_00345 [Oscillospiraceae bacterium]|nr:hypothetical protein [Oscillospiraceae bacterium]